MTTTARDIVISAMRKAGILTKSDSPSADEVNDALDTLNDILASHSNEGLMVYARTLENFTLSGGDSEYTIGVGGDFNTQRPMRIVSGYVRIDTVDYPLFVIKDEDYADIANKSSVNSIPYYINYNNAFPLATIKLYPIPAGSYQLFLLTEKELPEFTLDETVSLPAGWRRYLKNMLAIELSSEYGQQAPAELIEIASRSIANIRRGVARVRTMDNPTYGGQYSNVYTGWYD